MLLSHRIIWGIGMIEYLLCVIIAGLGFIFVGLHKERSDLDTWSFYIGVFVAGSMIYGLLHLALWGWSEVAGGWLNQPEV